MEEDKRAICLCLSMTLRLTREYHDLSELKYDSDKEVVVATFAGGCTRVINVACDSGVAMVRDILRGL